MSRERTIAGGHRLRRLSIVASATVVLLGVWAGLTEPWFVGTLHNAVFDAYQRSQPRPYQDVPVRIVDIDEATLARLGQWPWPRSKIATLVASLRNLGASAIASDFFFAEPDRTSPSWLAAEWTERPEVARMLASLPDHDAELAAELRRGSFVTAFALTDEPGGPAPLRKARFVRLGSDAPLPASYYPGAVVSLPILQEAASGNGAVNFSPDRDGVVRRVPVVVQKNGELYPSLVAEALRVASGSGNLTITSEARGAGAAMTSMRIGNTVMPTDSFGRVRAYLTSRVPQRYVPAWKVMEGSAEGLIPKGSIVFLGSSATGLEDLRFSPLGEVIPGVEIHAQITEQALLGVFATRPLWVQGMETLAMVLGWLVMVAFGRTQRALTTALALACMLAAMTAFSLHAWTSGMVMADPMLPALVLLAAFLAYTLPRQLATENEGQWIRGVFANYLSPNLVDHLIANPGELKLGGERRECSFVLSDVEGFTSLVEGMEDPEQLAKILNDYLEGMVGIAFAHDGTLDRIVGDAVAVLFSAPVQQPDHPERAIHCALAMDAFAREYSASCRAAGIPFGRTRIGVHTGEVVVGNFGGSSHFDYRPLGDPINTAARLETANRHLGTTVCASSATVSRCPGFVGRAAGMLVLKGKTMAIEVHEVLGPDDPRRATLDAWKAAYALMADDRDREGALAALEALCAADPDDGLAAFHRDRLRRGEGGVRVVFTEK